MINHRIGFTGDWDPFFKMLRDGGHLVGGSALDHGITIKNGVFGPAQTPTIAGYIVIQAKNLDAAKNIMAQNPIHQAGGTVELFTLV